MKPLTRRPWVLAARALVLVAAASLPLLLPRGQPQGRALERYVSPPLDARGTRVECLRPVGWQLTGAAAQDKSRFLTLEPSDRLALWRRWLPAPFLRWLPGREQGELTLRVFPVLDARSRRYNRLHIDNSRVRVYPKSDFPGSPITSTYATRRMVSEDGRYVLDLSYSRNSLPEQKAFHRTYRQIVGSLRIAEAATP